MAIPIEDFQVKAGVRVTLRDWPTHIPPIYKSKDHYRQLLEAHNERLNARQALLHASGRYTVLLIFQAMDTAGKDGAIKHVMSGVNPQGCQVFSFQRPHATELKHDFLWRAVQCLPERGKIGIFNRSYYEEVLIVRVHADLLQAEQLPPALRHKKNLWMHRYHSIVELERHLHRNGTRVVKFFLHLSKEEQRKRLLARIDQPDKNWKFDLGDMKERAYWKQYMKAYEECLNATHTRHAPWYIVPADDKENARLIISRIVLKTLEDLRLSYPKISAKRRRELQSFRELLGG